MEKNFVITVTANQLATVITAISMELERDGYSDEIRAELFDAFLAVSNFKVERT